MRLSSKPLLIALGTMAALALIAVAVNSFRHRFVRENHELLALLPSGDVTTFYADIGALRSAGLLALLSGTKAAGDAEYRKFVAETKFDYTKDLDAVAGMTSGDLTLLAARGRFDWSTLEKYAAAHGGTCRHEVCRVPASRPGRWISFLPVQPDVMGVALSPDETAVEQMKPAQHLAEQPVPSAQPVWVEVAHSVLKSPLTLPLPVRIFAVSLESADHVIFSLGKSPDPRLAVFNVQLDALCPNRATAESTRNQLEIQTKMMGVELAREHAAPNPADLTGLLMGGGFEVVDKRVIGSWPVSQQLLNTLE